MRVALLKDPEVRARIEQPLPDAPPPPAAPAGADATQRRLAEPAT